MIEDDSMIHFPALEEEPVKKTKHKNRIDYSDPFPFNPKERWADKDTTGSKLGKKYKKKPK